jgi:hypothetical protein
MFQQKPSLPPTLTPPSTTHRLPTYEHLRVFGYVCYPNLPMTAPHKLAPRSTQYVSIIYSLDHKGYRCLDISINRVVISRHVVFDEACFPFTASPPFTNDYKFLSKMDSILSPIITRLNGGTPMTTVVGLTAPVAEAGGSTTLPGRVNKFGAFCRNSMDSVRLNSKIIEFTVHKFKKIKNIKIRKNM